MLCSAGVHPDGRGPRALLHRPLDVAACATVGSFAFGQTVALALAPSAGRVLEHTGVVKAIGDGVGVGPDRAQAFGPGAAGLAGVRVHARG